jgi:hypothetical protein
MQWGEMGAMRWWSRSHSSAKLPSPFRRTFHIQFWNAWDTDGERESPHAGPQDSSSARL